MNCIATNPVAIIRFHVGGMILHIYIDASYLSDSKAQSRVSGAHFLSDSPPKQEDWKDYTPLLNEIVHVVYNILRNVIVSATETELGTLFVNE